MSIGAAPSPLETANVQAKEPKVGAVQTSAEWAEALVDASDAEFSAIWLHKQCVSIPGVHSGLVLLAGTGGLLEAAIWPPGRRPTADVARIAGRAGMATRPIIAWTRATNRDTGLDLTIGLGIQFLDRPAAALAVSICVPGGVESVDPDALAARLHMGCGWLHARLSRRQADTGAAQIERALVAMDIVAIAGIERQLAGAATRIVNELTIRLNCDRVSLGLQRRGKVKLRAISHTVKFRDRGIVVDAIEDAMEECLVQRAPVAHPPVLGMRTRVSLAHCDLAALTRKSGGAAASVLLPSSDGPVGVLTFERHSGTCFDAATLLLAEATGALLGPVLQIQVANHRMFAGRLVDAVSEATAFFLGRRRPALKLAAIALLTAVFALGVAKGEYRVSGRAVLEGEIQRAATAPFDGFVATSSIRPGDVVKTGDVLAAMDDRDLILERSRAWADTEKLRQQYNEAMAKHDRANMAVVAAQIEQAESQLALADDRLQRSKIASPIDGLIVSGDLSQTLGSPVERGKTLFEIAPLDRYRVIVQVDDRDLRFVSPGQRGQLALAGTPGIRNPFVISRITPIAETKDGRNQFRVEGMLAEPPGPDLRPGMEGVAKVETGSHRLIWIWSHGILDWLRLVAWKWLP